MENKEEKQNINHNPLEMNKISEKTGRNMITRIVSAIVMLLICVPSSFVGTWVFFGLILLLVVISIIEVIRVPGSKKIGVLLWLALFIMTLLNVYWGFIKNALYFRDDITKNGFSNALLFGYGFAGDNSGTLYISSILIGLSFIVLFLVTIANENFTIKDVFYYFGMSILIGLGFQGFYYIRYLPFNYAPDTFIDGGVNEYLTSSLLFFYVVIGTMITDIGAYFVGVLFGKHKMNPRISPNKTWEGFFGGIVISLLCSLSYIFILDACGVPVLPGVIDIEHWYWVLLISFIMPLVGNLGDLAFSAIKRDYSIKDYGNIIPGHGGVLDRIDSMLFSSIIVSLLLQIIVNNWNIIG